MARSAKVTGSVSVISNVSPDGAAVPFAATSPLRNSESEVIASGCAKRNVTFWMVRGVSIPSVVILNERTGISFSPNPTAVVPVPCCAEETTSIGLGSYERTMEVNPPV